VRGEGVLPVVVVLQLLTILQLFPIIVVDTKIR